MAIIIQPKRWSIKPPLGAQISYGNPLANGLVGCWLLNEGGGQPRDLRHSTAATLNSSAAVWTAGDKGALLKITANSVDPVDCPTNPDYNCGQHFTIVCRATIIGSVFNGAILVCKSFNGSLIPFLLNASSNGGGNTLYVGAAFYDGAWHQSGITTNVDGDGIYHTFAGTYDGATLKYYIDGRLDASAAATTASSLNNSGDVIFGRQSTDNALLNGNITYVYLYNRTLTQSEICQLHLDPWCFIQPQSPQRRFWVSAAPVVNTDPPFGVIGQPTPHYSPNIIVV